MIDSVYNCYVTSAYHSSYGLEMEKLYLHKKLLCIHIINITAFQSCNNISSTMAMVMCIMGEEE